MPDVLQLQLSGLALLIATLGVSVVWRRRKLWQQQLADQLSDWEFRRSWQPHALDTSRIAPQIRQVRRDPVAAVRHRPRHVGYRQQLMTSAREAIMHQSYFQLAKTRGPRKTEGEAQ